MRKLYAFLTATLVLAFILCPALAAGKLTITQENVLVLPYEAYFKCELYLEVQNTGDKAVQMNVGLFELMDAAGNVINSVDLDAYDLYPAVLQPSEYGYLYRSVDLIEATSSDYVGSYSVSVTGKGKVDADVTRYPTVARYESVTNADGSRKDFIVAIITNNTDYTVYDFDVGFEFLDDSGNLLFTTTGYWTYTGILAHSSIEVYLDVPENVTAYWVANSITPASAIASAFTTIDR